MSLAQTTQDVKHGLYLINKFGDWAGFLNDVQVTPECFSQDEAREWWAEAIRAEAQRSVLLTVADETTAITMDDEIPFNGEYPSYKYTPPVSRWADDEVPF